MKIICSVGMLLTLLGFAFAVGLFLGVQLAAKRSTGSASPLANVVVVGQLVPRRPVA